MEYTAILDRIILKQSEGTNISKGGIILAEEVKEFNGVVLSVGPDVKHVKCGDTAYFEERRFIKANGLVVLNEKDILFIKEK